MPNLVDYKAHCAELIVIKVTTATVKCGIAEFFMIANFFLVRALIITDVFQK